MRHRFDEGRLTVTFDSQAEYCTFYGREVLGGRFFLPCVGAPPQGVRLEVVVEVPGLSSVRLKATVDGHVDITGETGAAILFDEAQRVEVTELESNFQRFRVAVTSPDLASDPLEEASLEEASLVSLESAAVVIGAGPPGQDRTPAPVPAPTGTGTLAAGAVIAGRFRIDRHLATGGMGAVYEATHTFMNRKVALKLLAPQFNANPEMAARFQREAQLVAAIEHPNIVRIHDFGHTDDGRLYLAMEFAKGEPLEALIDRQGAIAPESAVAILCGVAGALGAAHQKGVVHRDVKPANIMVEDRDGELSSKVLDFGIARLADAVNEGGASMTRAGMVIGTPHYLAPEQAYAQPVDGRTDVYALGIVAYQVFTGALPFDSADLQKLVSMHLTAPPPPLAAKCPALAHATAIEAVIHQAMAKSPEQRFQSMEAFANALRSALALLLRQDAAVPAPALTPSPPAAAPALTPVPPAAAPAPPGAGWTGVVSGLLGSRPLPQPLDESLAELDGGLSPAMRAGVRSAREALTAAPNAVVLHLQLVGLGKLADFIESYEEALALPGAVRALILRTVHVHGGVIDWLERDELICLFPGPTDGLQALRAVRTAVRLRDQIDAVCRAIAADLPLRLRFGWGLGEVVISPDGGPSTGAAPAAARDALTFSGDGALLVPAEIVAGLEAQVEQRPSPSDPSRREVGALCAPLYGAPPDLLLRGRDLDVLDDLLKKVATEPVPAALIEGDAGSGKSRLLEAAGDSARARGFRVLLATAPDPVFDAGYLERLLRALLGVDARAPADEVEAAVGGLTLPDDLLGAVRVAAGVAPPPPGFGASELCAAFLAALEAVAEARPVFLGLDDLDAADTSSREALLLALRRKLRRVLLVASTRPGSIALPQVPRLALEPLREDEVTLLLRHTLGGAVPRQTLTSFVARVSEGRPLAVVSWLLHLEAAGFLRLAADGIGLDVTPPELELSTLLAARVITLPPPLAALAAPALLLGEAFAQATVDASAGAVATQALWDQLERAGVVRALGRGWRRLAGRVWQEAAEVQLAGVCCRRHARLAAALREQVVDLQHAPPAREIAAQLAAAGDLREARTWFVRAGESALRAGLLARAAEAAEALGAFLEAVPDPKAAEREGATLFIVRAAALWQMAGRPAAAERLLARTILETVEEPRTRALLAVVRGKLSRGSPSAIAGLEKAREVTLEPGVRALTSLELAEQLSAHKQDAAAAPLYEEALAGAPTAVREGPWMGEIAFQARAQALHGRTLFRLGLGERAREAFEAATVLLERAGQIAPQARILSTLASMARRAGDIEGSEKCLTQAAAAAATAGDLRFLCATLLSLAEQAAGRNDGPRAKQKAARSRAISLRVGYQELTVRADKILGRRG